MRGTAFLRAVGRLKPGITVEQARAALQLLENSYRSQYPEKIDAKSGTVVKTLPEDVTENLRPGFATLLAAVTFVLLIACSNVANLLLVRFSGRRREISLRMALGASRASVLRLFVFESVLISLVAGILGRGRSRGNWFRWCRNLRLIFFRLRPGPRPALSFPVLVFTIALSLSPAWSWDCIRAAKLARGHGGCAEGRRSRNRRQRATTAFPQIVGRRAGRPLGHAGRWSVATHRQFRAAESSRSWVQTRESLDRPDSHAAGAISGCRFPRRVSPSK